MSVGLSSGQLGSNSGCSSQLGSWSRRAQMKHQACISTSSGSEELAGCQNQHEGERITDQRGGLR